MYINLIIRNIKIHLINYFLQFKKKKNMVTEKDCVYNDAISYRIHFNTKDINIEILLSLI